MKPSLRCCVPLLLGWQLAFVPTFARAYEVGTHYKLTELAFKRSVLGSLKDNPLLELGIADPGATLRRQAHEFADPTYSSPLQIVADGAKLEDNPLAEGRYLRHFFDPQQAGIGLGGTMTPSPDWVLEDRGEITLQKYSLRDALGFHLQALTNPTQAEREAPLVTLLEILGRSVHHLQDMSQPAHARVDPHLPYLDGDIYEEYTEEWFETHLIPSDAVYGGPVTLPDYFDTARAFWANDGSGIAEFTSHNFVSKDTNFRLAGSTFQPDQNHPLPAAANSSTVTLANLGLTWTLNPLATVEFVHTQIQDQYSGASFVNDRASTYSIFNADMTQIGAPAKLALNEFNFKKNYEILLPRAIAYSSGLINYYFRGRLQLENMARQGGSVALTVKNASEPFYIMEGNPDLSAADFRLYYDARDGVRRELELTGGELTSPLTLNGTLDLSFVEPSDVDRAKEKPYLLVFNGIVGVEPGIAALAFGSGGAGFLVTPKYPPTDGIAGPRVIRWNDGGWNLTDDSGIQAGSVDWKGHNPIDVLSWDGGSGRYQLGGDTAIYMNGRVLAHAPSRVLGASIRYLNGLRTLNVATNSRRELAIYSRTFADSYASDELWSEENPLGWRLVYSQQHGSPFTGFFFNASGTEGQYITENVDGGGPSERVKVTLHEDLGLAETFPAAASVTLVSRNQQTDTTGPEVTAGVCNVSENAPDGVLEYGLLDGCLAAGLSGTRSLESNNSKTEEYSERTLFCVDYKGDTEVFCELLPPQQSQVYLNRSRRSIERNYLAYKTGWPYPTSCGTERNDANVTGEASSSSNSVRMMRIGGRSIPWVVREATGSSVDHYSGTFISPDAYTGYRIETATSNSRISKLIYADARYDLVVYETSTQQSTYSSSGSYTQASGYEYPTAITERTESSVQVIFASSEREVTLYQRDEEQNNDRTGSRTIGSLPRDGFACAERPRTADESTSAPLQRDPEAVQNIYSSMAKHGSYAVDRYGRIAASQLVIFEPPNGGPPLENPVYRYFLTNGNLPGLIPGTPPTEGYGYTIELIR